jgi:hypothetical protein
MGNRAEVRSCALVKVHRPELGLGISRQRLKGPNPPSSRVGATALLTALTFNLLGAPS